MNDRTIARAYGKRKYAAECILHGVTDHSVAWGLCLTCYDTQGRIRTQKGNPSGLYVDRGGTVRPLVPESFEGAVYVLDFHRILSGGNWYRTSSVPMREFRAMPDAQTLYYNPAYPSGHLDGLLVNVVPGDPAFDDYLKIKGYPKMARGDFYVEDVSRRPGSLLFVNNRTYVNRHPK